MSSPSPYEDSVNDEREQLHLSPPSTSAPTFCIETRGHGSTNITVHNAPVIYKTEASSFTATMNAGKEQGKSPPTSGENHKA
ncbi:hypothetical protein PoB_006660500 [Plakobranchus ocellatus]|uniref:Uncharacterized protein n=1 Tax=Plakobranchus ocellatus TaxID=259542 RepID=A0AAV4D7S1_9GAST|nr:hypothetical protein PoB_006660500 [Plakobranchus ocellatus]